MGSDGLMPGGIVKAHRAVVVAAAENIYRDDEPGFDIIFEASEIGIPPGNPPDEITVSIPTMSKIIKFGLCGSTVKPNGEFMYWSYWNEAPQEAIQLKIFND